MGWIHLFLHLEKLLVSSTIVQGNVTIQVQSPKSKGLGVTLFCHATHHISACAHTTKTFLSNQTSNWAQIFTVDSPDLKNSIQDCDKVESNSSKSLLRMLKPSCCSRVKSQCSAPDICWCFWELIQFFLPKIISAPDHVFSHYINFLLTPDISPD